MNFLLVAVLLAAPDDSEPARAAAVARLRSAKPSKVCGVSPRGTPAYGTTCASREFPAPPLLQAPRIQWSVEPGWWAVWSPYVVDGLVLTGSCNNETNKGLSALDARTGKTRWRLAAFCDEGNRAGSMGQASFHEAAPGKVVFSLSRDDGKPNDWQLIDVATGKVERPLTPLKRGPTREAGGVFTVLTASKQDQRSYLNALSPSLDRQLWRQDLFRHTCDKLDRWCEPVFSASATFDGVLFLSATALEQPEPPTRQLHAFSLTDGRLLWKHTAQPVRMRDGQGLEHRSDDGAPMVVDGKVLIRVEDADGFSLRALEPKTGRVAWNTAPVPRHVTVDAREDRRVLEQWLGAGSVVVGLASGDLGADLLAWSAADGRLLWSRPVHRLTVLTASASGAFYTALPPLDRKDGERGELLLEGFEATTGTRLWSTPLDAHDRPFTAEWSITERGSGMTQGPSWRIGPDGAVYGITLKGAYKLQ